MISLEEAKIIAEIVNTADDGCDHCIKGLIEKMQDKFPEYDWEKLSDEAPKLWGNK